MSHRKRNPVPQLPADKEVDEVKAQVDEIFELAKSNMWDFEQFAKKILAGTVARNPGYVAIAMALRAPQATNLLPLSLDYKVTLIMPFCCI